MRIRLPVFALLALSIVGCSETPIQQEYMIISPKTVIFAPTDSLKSVSITHSCTCPFSWNASIIPAADSAWLLFPTHQSGDKSDVQISIRPSLLPSDTSRARILIVSNSYGADTINVLAIK